MKKWESPKLIVLVRARPEESILGSCKTYSGPTAGPDADDYWCWNYDCELCYTEATS
jgi:hypothetical protein